MRVEELKLLNFRNIEYADVDFTEGVNILWGENAQGKTNLMEALQFFGCGKSFRLAKDGDLVRFGEEETCLSLDFVKGNAPRNMTFVFPKGAKEERTLLMNKLAYRNMSELLGNFSTVLFTPEHLRLIKEGPAVRRNFLDMVLCTMRPMYLKTLQRYNRILRERNTLLRNAAAGEYGRDKTQILAMMDPWTCQLTEESVLITQMRAEYIQQMNICVQDCFRDMTGGRETPELRYDCSFLKDGDTVFDSEAFKRELLDRFHEAAEREMNLGYTLLGPHRDDFEIFLDGKSSRLFASQGQQRSLALAIKLGEGEILKKQTGSTPVYLLDDVLSELDGGRREYLLSRLGDRQVIMTCCEPGVVAEKICGGADRTNLIHVEAGCFETDFG